MADDEETAKKVAFNNDYGKFNCVTLKGDKYSPSGTLEGGFKKESGILLNVQKYLDIYQKGSALSDSLRRVQNEI